MASVIQGFLSLRGVDRTKYKDVLNLEDDRKILQKLSSMEYDIGKLQEGIESKTYLKHISLDGSFSSKEEIDRYLLKEHKNYAIPFYIDKKDRIIYIATTRTDSSGTFGIRDSYSDAYEDYKRVEVMFCYDYEFDLLSAGDFDELLKPNNFIKGLESEKKLKGELKNIYEKQEKFHVFEEKFSLREVGRNAPKFVNDMLRYAYENRASDIHVEPQRWGFQVRFRVDGDLSIVRKYIGNENDIKTLQSSIFNIIKTISQFPPQKKKAPQDGRIADVVVDEQNNKKIDLRVSTVETSFGEKIVMRLFDKSQQVLSFAELGLQEEDILKMKRLLKSPDGIVLLSGPTGSGKTTTLYTMVEHVKNPLINIYSIEDPIEKEILGVNQIELNEDAGITIESVLRAMMRQDPNVVMVGEIRDGVTATMAANLSITGHFILTTVHANSASGIISRLLNLGIESHLLATTARGLIAQRLVKRLCPHCKKNVGDQLTKTQEIWLDYMIEKYGDGLEIDKSEIFGPAEGGCPHCKGIGYYNRLAVVEIVEVSDKLRELIADKADTTTVENQVFKEKNKPLQKDLLEKIKSGDTSIDEAMKVATIEIG